MDENAVKTEKLKLPLTHSTFMKAVAFIMTIVLLAVTAAGVIGAVLMWEYDVYHTEKEDFLQDLNWGSCHTDSHEIAYYVGINDFESARKYIESRNIEAVDISCTGDQRWSWAYGAWDDSSEADFSYNWKYSVSGSGNAIPGYDARERNVMFVRLRVADVPTAYDAYWLAYWVTEITYAMLYAVYIVIAAAFVLSAVCIIYLINAAGHRPKKPGITPSWATWIPFDLLTAAMVLLGVLGVYLCDAVMWAPAYELLSIAAVVFVCVVCAVMVLGWLMSAALRIKLRSIFSNTLIFMLLRLCRKALKWCWRGICRFCAAIVRCGERVTLFWKVSLVFLGLCLVEFVVIIATQDNAGVEFVLWLISRLIILAGLVYICHVLKELHKCGRAVAEGDLSYTVDTRYMPSQFREHAANLRILSASVNKAVEQRMVSERMKTELITNVSHDLKTPLTSLINYSDLICRESCDNPHHGEYAEVLHRQSRRMRRLIDDLVEASKASSGNLDVTLAPCEAGVLLAQAAGEYEQRLQEKGLRLVTSQPKQTLSIMADGRRLWRVVDNLMNNICKYALEGTRVYLTLEEVGDEAVISFKNTSRDQLNLGPEELMERFVRGDASRNSEGSGLGLSIARSLTELQGGKMGLMCDGDLFKVVLKFPTIK